MQQVWFKSYPVIHFHACRNTKLLQKTKLIISLSTTLFLFQIQISGDDKFKRSHKLAQALNRVENIVGKALLKNSKAFVKAIQTQDCLIKCQCKRCMVESILQESRVPVNRGRFM